VNTHDPDSVEILFREHAFSLFLDIEDAPLKLMNRFLESG
jgi:hypothetical protein